MACKLTRVIVPSSRLSQRWRHFCTEAIPSPTPTPTPTASLFLKPGTPKSSCSGSDVDVSRSGPHGLMPADTPEPHEVEQCQEHKRKEQIFFRRPRSSEAIRKFLDAVYDNYTWNERRYPGQLFKIIRGDYKGYRLYKPNLEVIPRSLDWVDDPEWQRIFIENREMWYKEGLFDIAFEGNVFILSYLIHNECYNLTEAEALGIPNYKQPATWDIGERIRITKSVDRYKQK